MGNFVSPAYGVRAVPIEKIVANSYNPNIMAPPEMRFLIEQISAIAQLVFRQESPTLQNRKGQYPLNLRVCLHHLELDILIHVGTSPAGVIILSAKHS